MVTYEVTAEVRADLADAYAHYMQAEHIPDVLATGAFTGAAFERTGAGSFRVRYRAATQAALDAYLATDTQRLRAAFVARFPDGVTLARAQWTLVQRWQHDAR